MARENKTQAAGGEMFVDDFGVRAGAKRALPRSRKRIAPQSVQSWQYVRVAAAEFILPRNCFVQNDPNFNELLHFFPGSRDAIRRYNLDYSKDKGKFVVDGNRFLQLRLLLRHAACLPGGDY